GSGAHAWRRQRFIMHREEEVVVEQNWVGQDVQHLDQVMCWNRGQQCAELVRPEALRMVPQPAIRQRLITAIRWRVSCGNSAPVCIEVAARRGYRGLGNAAAVDPSV